MDEQKQYEVIKDLADHPYPNKERAALTLERFTDNPLDQERNKFLALTSRRALMGQGTGLL